MLAALYGLLLLAVLLLGLSVLIFQGITGVPPMSSSTAEGAEVVGLLQQAGLPDDAVIYDLGSGWGALIIALAHAFPTAQIKGVEISPLPYWVSRLRTRHLANVLVRRGSFYDCNLQDADAVTCYLFIKPMTKLAGYLDTQLAPGTPVVSLSFAFRDRAAAATRQGAGPLGQAALYQWPARKPGG